MRAIGKDTLEGSTLFRARELTYITPEEADTLVQHFGIRSIYDIRTQWEVAANPEPYLMGTKTIALEPSYERRRKNASKRLIAGVIGEYGAPEERMINNYRNYAKEYPLLGTALRSIASEGSSALIHCVNGKDRTGVLAATLLRIAGMHHDDIMTDYLATNELQADLIAQEAARLNAGMTSTEEAILMSFLEARPAYLQAFFKEAKEAHGSFDRYVSEGLRLMPEHCYQIAQMLAL